MGTAIRHFLQRDLALLDEENDEVDVVQYDVVLIDLAWLFKTKPRSFCIWHVRLYLPCRKGDRFETSYRKILILY